MRFWFAESLVTLFDFLCAITGHRFGCLFVNRRPFKRIHDWAFNVVHPMPTHRTQYAAPVPSDWLMPYTTTNGTGATTVTTWYPNDHRMRDDL